MNIIPTTVGKNPLEQIEYPHSQQESKCSFYVCAKLLQLCSTLSHPMDCSPPRSLSIGFSGQEYWSGFSCLPSGDLPKQGMELMSVKSPALEGRFFTTRATWEVPKMQNLGATSKKTE